MPLFSFHKELPLTEPLAKPVAVQLLMTTLNGVPTPAGSELSISMAALPVTGAEAVKVQLLKVAVWFTIAPSLYTSTLLPAQRNVQSLNVILVEP